MTAAGNPDKKRRARRIAADEAHSWARNLRLKNAHAKYVLCMLTLYVNGDGVCFVSIPQLSEDCELGPQTVRDRLAWLEANGAIARRGQWIDDKGQRNSASRGRRTSDEIVLLLDVDPDEIEARISSTFDKSGPIQCTGSDCEPATACPSASTPPGTPLGTPATLYLPIVPESSEPDPERESVVAVAREPLISELATALADDLMQIFGIDREFTPPGWCGAAMWLDVGLKTGWRPDVVRLAATKIRARKNYQPPTSFRYLDKPVVREHQLASEKPTPIAPSAISNQETDNAKTAPDNTAGWRASRDRWRSTVAKLNASIAADRAREGTGG